MSQDKRNRDRTMREISHMKDKSTIGEPKKFFSFNTSDSNVEAAVADTEKNKRFRQVPMINEAPMIQKELDVKEYNENVTKLNPLYTALIPTNRIIVRCFHIETYRTEGGLIIEPKIKIPVPTQNGYGMIGEISSPYAYQKLAVVVAIPESLRRNESNKLVPGALVQLASNPLKGRKAGKEFDVDLPYGFTHYTYPEVLPPSNLKSEHYGYLLIPGSEIQVIIPNIENDATSVKTKKNEQ